MNVLELLLILSLATACIAGTIARSKLFTAFRLRAHKEWGLLGEAISCSYCLSHWVSFCLVGIYFLLSAATGLWIDFIVFVFAVTAGASIFINLIWKD